MGKRSTGFKLETSPENIGRSSTWSRLALFALVTVLLFGLAGVFYNFYLNQKLPATFEIGETERLTGLGNINDAAVSPDGKYVAYVSNEGGSESLWLKQIQTGSNIQVVAPSSVSYQGLAISPDSSWIYYNMWDRKGVGEIFRVPVLGGLPQRVVHDCMPGITVSPDGKRLAFVRSNSVTQKLLLLSAAVDGGNEQQIFESAGDLGGVFSPTWSPDGTTIAFAGAKLVSPGKALAQIYEVPVTGGEPKVIWTAKDFNSFIGNGLVWLPDKSGLLISYTNAQQSYLQIWKISYPDGQETQLTKDLSSYGTLSISADGKKLISTEENRSQSVWTVPIDNPAAAKKVTSGKLEGFGVSWTLDNRITYSSAISGNFNIWIMNADGSNKKQLTNRDTNFEPCVAGNGKYIVFTSSQGGTANIWRIETDGRNPVQLTQTASWYTTCTPRSDQLFIIEFNKIGRMSVEGGPVTYFIENVERRPAISPDGKKLAYIFWNADEKQLDQEILNVETGERKRFELPAAAIRSINQPPLILRWTPDGKALSYVRDEMEVSNVWSLPLDGGKPKQITAFSENYISFFDWSPDGKQLVVSRGTRSSDVVLIKNPK